MCLIASANTFIHYAFFGKQLRGESFFLIDIFSSTILFLVCYYFCSRAGSLLPNAKVLILFLQIVFGCCILIIEMLGLYIFIRIYNYYANPSYPDSQKIDPHYLCYSNLFLSFSFFPIVVCIVFGITFYFINKKINEQNMENDFDNILADQKQKQLRTVKKIKQVLISYLII